MTRMKQERELVHARHHADLPADIRDAAQELSVIINADDWGSDVSTTNRTLDCVLSGAVSSVSAMVFMEDSERAARLAREHKVDAGLHLNFTLGFSGINCPPNLKEHQARVSRFLRSRRLAPVIYHPRLGASFKLLVQAQLEEYERIYGVPPRRVDGHHHMHLCSNVLMGKLLPAGTVVHRNFSFLPGEKSWLNRSYRGLQDWLLARRHRTTRMFFALPPLEPPHLAKIVDFAAKCKVEIETHPAVPDEYEFLQSGKHKLFTGKVTIAQGYSLDERFPSTVVENGRLGDDCTPTESVSPPDQTGVVPVEELPHISVCVCTYKRPQQLRALLIDLSKQHTSGLFTYSIVVADNDPARSAESAIAEMQQSLSVPIKYCSEPRRSIAMARNKVVENASGEYLALIDDDEYPISNWLLSLFTTINQYKVDGVLGPVKRHFEEVPPEWFKKSRIYDRRINPTGMRVDWHEARTGNALLRRGLVAGDPLPFRPEFRAGEDQDFFRRKLEEGRKFIWSSEAAVFEVIPPARWRRRYIVRKALLHGVNGAQQPTCTGISVFKSIIAVPAYVFCLPLALLAGQGRFMELVIKLCNHVGKLLYLMKINPIREEYVSD